ncbi:O-antigen polymerase [Bacteroides cellulosilyticus]|jgi:oligosaccharide repeat unit polymerase|uniref:Oligosaccharide repeat unit polymerase n=1 Tax=Bacteroides cellulosilyticus TaxID=246787 RepID=A0A412IMC2_9BACE|nr:O-antigen polymerase [Bacteroides cellulosilyticus]RGS39060.1 oligosaccharide repeat unit polymerase [Bacteroides cellulosilyticus]
MLLPIIIVVFSVIGGVFFWRKKKNLWNPVSVFLFEWALVVYLSSLRLYNLIDISSKAYIFVLIGVISFFIGSLFGDNLRLGKKRIGRVYEINYTRMNIASIVIIVFSLFRILFIIKLLSGGFSWWEIRLMSTSGEGGIGTLKGGNVSVFLHDCIIAPLMYLIVPTLFAELLVGARNKKFILLSLIAMTCYSISTVSRAVWAFSVLYILFIVLLYRKKYSLPKKVKRMMKYGIFIIIFLCVIIYRITLMRNVEADILTNMYAYITGCMPLLTLHLNEVTSSIRTYGAMSLYGFLYPVFFVLNYLHLLPYPDAFMDAQYVKNSLETFMPLSPDITMNAYVTLFYYFYIDFGYLGIIIGAFAFGYLCMKSYKYLKSTGDIRSLVLYLILIQFIVFSVARIYTGLSTRALSIVWLLFVFKSIGNKYTLNNK